MELFQNIRKHFRTPEQLNITNDQLLASIERGNERGISKAEYDVLGVAFGAIRLDKKLTVDELAAKSGVRKEDIIDLELASFRFTEAALIAKKLASALDIKESDFNNILISSIRKK